MWTWIVGCLLLTLALLALRYVVITRATRAAHRKLIELRLEGLKFMIQDWKSCAYELVPYDTDQYPESHHFWRTIRIQPNAATTWYFNIDMQKRYRVNVVQKGQEETWYPKRHDWSTEPWLKMRIDLMLWQIQQLPPPRTFQEHLAKANEAHRAKMAEYDRRHEERQRWRAEQQTIGGTFTSLDDPMDDMD